MNSTKTDIEGGKGGSLAFPEEQAPAATDVSAPTSNNNKKKKRIIIGVIASLALIGLVVGLSVGLTRNNGGGGDQAPDSTETVVTPQFTESKAFMDTICSEDDKTLCEEKCEPVDCCNPFAENNCLMENAEKCMEYAACHVVTELQSRGAPEDLATTCATASNDCKEACDDVKCCFDDVDTCQDTQFLTCMDYAPCQVLNPKATITPASSELIEKCLDPEQRADCEDECEKASCCWDMTDSNCLETDMISCMTYAPCGSLLIPVPNTVVERPNDSFGQDCSIDSVVTSDGYDKCEEHCGEASCCTAEGAENCFSTDPVGCLQHLQCGLLALAGGSVTPLTETEQETLKETCDLQEILNGGNTKDCQDACEDAKCCVSQDENCLADGNVLGCATYLPCLPVLALEETGLGDIFSGDGLPDFGDGYPDFNFGEGTIGEPPEDLATTCSNDETLDECEELCKEVKCCTSTGDDNCLLENIIMCATWNIQGCFAVHGFQQA